MPIEIPAGSRTAGPVPTAAPSRRSVDPADARRRSIWERLRRKTPAGDRPASPYRPMYRNLPGAGTARFGGRVAGGLLRGGARLGTGLPGLAYGALRPSDIASAAQEFDPNQFADVQGQEIPGMYESFSPRAGEYSPQYQPFQRPVTYGDVPDYDEELLQNLQSQYAQQDRAELEEKPVEDLSWWESFQRFGYRAQDALKEALAGESTPEERKPAPVYDLSKTGEEKRTDTPVASSTTEALGTTLPVETKSSTDRLLEILGGTGGGLDMEDLQKSYGEYAALGMLTSGDTRVANSFLSGALDLAQYEEDKKWRMTQLLTKPKVTWYPVLPREGTYVLDTSGDRAIVNQYAWEDAPPGYSPQMPEAPANTADMTEYKEAKRLMKEEGLAAAWAYKVGLGNVDTAMGQVQPDVAVGAYLAPIWYDLHRDMPMKVVPSPIKIDEMVKALQGRTFEEAVAAGDIDKEDWEMWISLYGNFRPSIGMLK
jgi:hypothetical protein